jgi:predicted acetyltransferase
MDRDDARDALRGVSVEPVGVDRRDVVERLCQLERHDLSRFMGWLPGDDGLFEVPSLDRFFAAPGHRACLIRAEGSVAGFCLTRPLEDGAQFIHSFFVVRALRRTGVGRRAAALLLAQQPGPWAIAFLEEYEEAGRFWRVVARDVAGTDWTEGRRTSPDGAHQFAWIELTATSG